MSALPRSPRFRGVAACLLLLAVAGCESGAARLQKLVGDTRPSGVKVLVVGIDGASPQVLQSLLAQQRLPAFKALIERGSHGTLRSLEPTVSPAIWTTIVTGKLPSEHGINDFTRRRWVGLHRRSVLVSSADRQSPALWNLVGPFSRSAGFVGWWASWPAEPVRGFIISDRMAQSRFTEWTKAERGASVAFPPELSRSLASLVMDPTNPPPGELEAMADFRAEEVTELAAVQKPIYAHGLSVFKFSYAEQRTYEEIALRMLSRGQPELTGIFLVANDPICHTFWHYYEPGRFQGVDPDKAARLGALIPAIYEHNDRFLARLLDSIGTETVILIVSDHGFEASGVVPESKNAADFLKNFDKARAEALRNGSIAVGQSGRHNLNGLVIAAGGPVRQGVEIRASVLDITPTVLALMGLPVAEDMPGRVLEEILAPEFLVRHPVRRIPSYDGLIAPPALEAFPEEDDPRRLEMLRSLGYIQ